MKNRWVFCFIALLSVIILGNGVLSSSLSSADDPSPPSTPVKLIFIHHSTGGNWLADPNGDQPYGRLAEALMQNNYYVSATNYGWGPEGIGDRTDIPNWPEWFTGSSRDTIMDAVFSETGQNFGDFGSWARLASDPGGENEIILFKSCFPNSDLYGNPNDPPLAEPNDLLTVENAKAVYNNILTYFAGHQNKLFVVITAPPLRSEETTAERAANARAFNNWLVNDWLDGYPHNNVAVFDYYNVLTSNNGGPDQNDLGLETGNHHRWWNGAVQHVTGVNNNFASYPSGDSHPSSAGHQKATAEFLPLLNIFYHRWKSGATPSATLTLTSPDGGERWRVNSQHQIRWNTTGTVSQVHLYYSTDDFASSHVIATSVANTGEYAWTTPSTPTTTCRVRVEGADSPSTVFDISNADFTLSHQANLNFLLPLILSKIDQGQLGRRPAAVFLTAKGA